MVLARLFLALAVAGQTTSNVVVLQKLNFETLVYRTGTTARWFVKFYAPWCSHCKKIQPIWESLAESDDHTIRYGQVDCTAQSDLCRKFEVTGYPTLVLIDSKTRQYKKFSGAKTKDKIARFAESTEFATDDAPATSLKEGRARKKIALAKVTETSAEKPVKEIANTINRLPDEALLGPAIASTVNVKPQPPLDFSALLDFGPCSRVGNLYLYGITLIACIYTTVYIIAGGRKQADRVKID